MSERSHLEFEFGPYRVDSGDGLLWRGDQVVPLTPKAFEMLLVLVESNGQLLTKEELMKRVWADSFVEEANLSHNIYKLREALGEGPNGEKYIETVPRRGYRFVAKVTKVWDEDVERVVVEHTRAHIVIEEESGLVDAAAREPRPAGAAQLHQRRRGKGLALPLLALGLVVVGGGAALMAWKGLFRNAPQADERRAVVATREMTITRVTNSGKSGAGTISPDGKFIAYVQNYSTGKHEAGTGSLYVRQIGANNEIQLLKPGERESSAAPLFRPTAHSSTTPSLTSVTRRARSTAYQLSVGR
jgi:DNA-binding winged helix-turn-helix (wHTH) protein